MKIHLLISIVGNKAIYKVNNSLLLALVVSNNEGFSTLTAHILL